MVSALDDLDEPFCFSLRAFSLAHYGVYRVALQRLVPIDMARSCLLLLRDLCFLCYCIREKQRGGLSERERPEELD